MASMDLTLATAAVFSGGQLASATRSDRTAASGRPAPAPRTPRPRPSRRSRPEEGAGASVLRGGDGRVDLRHERLGRRREAADRVERAPSSPPAAA